MKQTMLPCQSWHHKSTEGPPHPLDERTAVLSVRNSSSFGRRTYCSFVCLPCRNVFRHFPSPKARETLSMPSAVSVYSMMRCFRRTSCTSRCKMYPVSPQMAYGPPTNAGDTYFSILHLFGGKRRKEGRKKTNCVQQLQKEEKNEVLTIGEKKSSVNNQV